MSSLILPAESDYTLALREPNLLVPGRQPQEPVVLNAASSLYAEIQPTYVLDAPRRQIIGAAIKSEKLIPIAGGSLRPFDGGGLSLAANGGTSDGLDTANGVSVFGGATVLSGYVEFSCTATTGAVCGQWGAAFGAWLITWNGNKLATVVASGSGTANYRGVYTTGALSAGVHKFGWTWAGGNDLTLYLDGKPVASTNWFTGSPASLFSQITPMTFCKHVGATGNGNHKIYNLIVSVNKAWSADAHARVAKSSFSLLRPANDTPFALTLPAVAPSTVTLSNLTFSARTATSITPRLDVTVS